MPSGGAPSAPVEDGGSHELVGVIATSQRTLVGITDTNTRKSFWIPVGKMVEGIEIISCDPKQDRAVIRVGGETKTLAMRTGVSSAPAAPVSTPTTITTGPSLSTGTQAEQEREARMLVSDLLEIGIQQRKAYEEAQRKAAQQKPSGNPPAKP